MMDIEGSLLYTSFHNDDTPQGARSEDGEDQCTVSRKPFHCEHVL